MYGMIMTSAEENNKEGKKDRKRGRDVLQFR